MPLAPTRRFPPWTRSLATGLVRCVGLAGGLALAAPPPTDEFTLKAQILRLALDYVEWPQGAGSTLGMREVAILGTTPMGEELVKAYSSGTASRVPTRVTFIPRMPTFFKAQVLFIAEGEAENLPRILAALKGRAVLTVGDTPGFAEQGVMLNLVRDGARVRMETHLGAVKAAGLEMSSALILKTRVVARPPGS